MSELKAFFPEYNKTIYALPGTSIFECITRAGILIRTPCGGTGICGKCAVRITSGNVLVSKGCLKFFSQEKINAGYRLACCTFLEEDISIEIPTETLLEHGVITLAATPDNSYDPESQNRNMSGCFSKLATLLNLKLSTPSLENPVSDIDNIVKSLGNVDIDLKMLKTIPELIRENDFSLSAVVAQNRLIALKSSEDTAEFAIAIDIGTTTIAGVLMNMQNGEQIANSGILNPQVKFGDDVLSRICFQSKSDKNIEKLKNSVIEGCNSLIEKLCFSHNIDKNNIYSVSIAGNTVMQTMFCGITAKFLGEIPFTAPFNRTMTLCAFDIGLQVNRNAEVVLFPVLGGFVGGDITAGLIAIDFRNRKDDGNALFVDVGTNGEIVLKSNGKMFSTAAAAGPAFEGAGIEQGMRAANGAIEKILIENGKVTFNVIGDVSPRGICGTALIDIVAELLKCGIIDETGRILSKDECKDEVLMYFPEADHLLNRIKPDSSNPNICSFLIADGLENKDGKNIFLSQKDVRSLQLASGAIRAAINILIKNAKITEKDIDTIYIAGGFGNYIRRSHAKRIGMIPDVADHKVHFVGNASLIGAKVVLQCREKLIEAEQLAKDVTVIDVSLDCEFQMEFANAMTFPK